MTRVHEGSVTSFSAPEARRLSPSLLLQPDLIDRFLKRSNEGRIVSLLQAPPQCGKTSFLKQVFRALEALNKNILWIDIQADKVSGADFTQTLAQILGIKTASYGEIAKHLEDHDQVLLIDNLDRVGDLTNFYQALKKHASNLRAIATVNRIPKIPTELAFEVSCWSYTGLSKDEVAELIKRHSPDRISELDDFWTKSRGNTYIFRLLLQAEADDRALREYWTTLLPTLSADLLRSLHKASLCESRRPESQSLFLRQIDKSDLVFLEQTSLVDSVDPSIMAGYCLNPVAKSWLQELIPDSRSREALREEMLESLAKESELAIREEYCWQLQRLERKAEALQELDTLLPLFYQNFRSNTGVRISQGLWQNLSPQTWNWRRLCMLDRKKSVQEVQSIVESLPEGTSIRTLADWYSVHLYALSRDGDWNEFESLLPKYQGVIAHSADAEMLVQAALTAYQLEKGDAQTSLTTGKKALEHCLQRGLSFRVTLDCLAATLITSLDAGDDFEARKCAKLFFELLKQHRIRSDGTNLIPHIFNLYLRLGYVESALQYTDQLFHLDPEEQTPKPRFQMGLLKSLNLYLRGLALEADRSFHDEVRHYLASESNKAVYSLFLPAISFRLTVGAYVEVLSVLDGAISTNAIAEDYARVFRTLRNSLEALSNGKDLSSIELDNFNLDIDYFDFLLPVLEYQWIENRLVPLDERLVLKLSKISKAKFPHYFQRIRLYEHLFAAARGENVEERTVAELGSYFRSRGLALDSLRCEILAALASISKSDFERALSHLETARNTFDFVQSPEDQLWICLIDAAISWGTGDFEAGTRKLGLIDPLSGVAKSRLYRQIAGLEPTTHGRLQDMVRDQQVKSWRIDLRQLVLLNSAGEPLIQDRPILIKLLAALLKHSPRAVDKEELVKTVWNEDYNPLVHDTRVYTSIRRLRDTINKVLGFENSIVSIEGTYLVSDEVRQSIDFN